MRASILLDFSFLITSIPHHSSCTSPADSRQLGNSRKAARTGLEHEQLLASGS